MYFRAVRGDRSSLMKKAHEWFALCWLYRGTNSFKLRSPIHSAKKSHAEKLINGSAFVPVVFFQCLFGAFFVKSHVYEAFYHSVIIRFLRVSFSPEFCRFLKSLSIIKVHFCNFGILRISWLWGWQQGSEWQQRCLNSKSRTPLIFEDVLKTRSRPLENKRILRRVH